jgi:hypothetical protein
MLSEPALVTLQVIEALDSLNIPYLIGGSFATAIHGIARMTADVDLIVDMRIDQAGALALALQDDFYLDVDAIWDAIRRHESFNMIHLQTMFKVDVFVMKQRSFDRSQMERREFVAIAQEPERFAYVATAEDNILAKLEWYRAGNETSERQWRDVQNVIKTQSSRLDRAYLSQWAISLGVADLLQRALDEASSI